MGVVLALIVPLINIVYFWGGTNYSGDKFVWKCLGKKVLDQEDTLWSKRPLYKKLAVNFERNTASKFWKKYCQQILKEICTSSKISKKYYRRLWKKYCQRRAARVNFKGQVSKWVLLSNFVCLQLVFATTLWTNVHELGWTCTCWKITSNQINAVCWHFPLIQI